MSESEKKKIDAAGVWAEYSEALSFKHAFSLFETVRRNEAFYIGDQWEGVNAPDLDKPVFNLLRRVVTYFISAIVSDDIAVSANGFGVGVAPGVPEMLEGQFSQVMEACGAKAKFRDMIRNAAVDGDGCVHYYFESGDGAEDFGRYLQGGTPGYIEAELPGFSAKAENAAPVQRRNRTQLRHEIYQTPGYIEAELLDNTAVCFGNPQLADVQRQPYILLAFRRRVEEVRRAARAAGCDAAAVVADSDPGGGAGHPAENGKVTVLRRYWKEKGRVWFCESVAGGMVKRPTDTGLSRYPLVWMPWEKVKNRYHGQAAITGMIPNQIFVNKLFAMAMQHVKMMAFPKVVYDRTKLPGGWTNQVGGAIGVAGNPADAVMTGAMVPEMSGQVLGMIESVIAYTRDTMGATDAALGNIRPENTSAIIAVQKASSMPLELQKMEFYRVVEESVRIWLDMMGANYGVRAVEMAGRMAEGHSSTPAAAGVTGAEGPDAGAVYFDFSSLRGMDLRLNVDIGAATYWSELVQVQTLDNLFERGIIPDAETYLELVPAAYLRDKGLLLEAVRRKGMAVAAEQELAAVSEAGTLAEGAPVADGEAVLLEATKDDPRPETPLLDLLAGGA